MTIVDVMAAACVPTGPPAAADAHEIIGGLAPIGLDELVARAALLTRVDRKYILPAADLPGLLGALAGEVAVLEIDGRREFDYRSVYFDTPWLDSYLSTAHRRRHRFKVRLRSYLDTGLHVLEVKTRGRRGVTVKQRVPYAGDGQRLGPDDRQLAGAVLAGAGIGADPYAFGRALTTRYRRTTLFLPDTGSRVTIDSGLRWSVPDGAALSTPRFVIVETKCGRVRSEMDHLLWSLRRRPCAVSKYATGLAALRPELPANRWQSVLRRHFRAPTEGTLR